MSKTTFSELIDDIESSLNNLREVPRRKTQYDEEVVLTIEREERNEILKKLRSLEREFYKKQMKERG